MSTEMEVLFFVGGLVAGIINTLAGNGSALTVSLLMFGGMDGAVANATNRIGVMTQTLTSVLSLRPSLRKRYLMRASRGLAIPTLLGSLAGAFLGISLPVNVIEWTLAFVMMGMGVTLFLKPERWGGPMASRALVLFNRVLWRLCPNGHWCFNAHCPRFRGPMVAARRQCHQAPHGLNIGYSSWIALCS
jgi:uncharacterized membrane protein YfcA